MIVKRWITVGVAGVALIALAHSAFAGESFATLGKVQAEALSEHQMATIEGKGTETGNPQSLFRLLRSVQLSSYFGLRSPVLVGPQPEPPITALR